MIFQRGRTRTMAVGVVPRGGERGHDVIPSLGRVRSLLFGIPRRAWAFDRLGFQPAEPGVHAHLQRILASFVEGFHATLEDSRPEVLLPRLAALTPEYLGFSYEGVGLCLAAFDLLTPWKRDRWQAFRDGPGKPHCFLLHVGYGLALARLGRPASEALNRLADSDDRWLAIDGYGFYQGFFHWHQFAECHSRPARLKGFAARVFDQGLGRCLWFGCGADIDRIARTVAAFPLERHADLWCGLGVAATYAGGCGEPELRALLDRAAGHRAHFRQGCVFATKLRHHAGNVVAHTRLACRVLSGLSVEEAVRLVDSARESLPPERPDLPNYEALRRRVQDQLTSSMELHS